MSGAQVKPPKIIIKRKRVLTSEAYSHYELPTLHEEEAVVEEEDSEDDVIRKISSSDLLDLSDPSSDPPRQVPPTTLQDLWQVDRQDNGNDAEGTASNHMIGDISYGTLFAFVVHLLT